MLNISRSLLRKSLFRQSCFVFSEKSEAQKNYELNALSPLDGRYERNITPLKDYFSEAALIRYRVTVEIQWLKYLVQNKMVKLPDGKTFEGSATDLKTLTQIFENFSFKDAQRVKEIESVTNHDVKSVEYFIKEKIEASAGLQDLKEYVHFCCTSEDINNLAYSLLMKEAKDGELMKNLLTVENKLISLSEQNANLPMLGKTHGQVATPTTLGKEFANFAYRANRQITHIKNQKFSSKLNGAVGNFNAHYFAYPEYNWGSISKEFIESIGLEFNPYTTQIEPHDSIAEFYNSFSLLNTIYIGFCRDLWTYMSIGYFRQKIKEGEVGSSTMPHKVNPIDFENCEGNLGVANSIMIHCAQKLPISRWQRDLSDSTVMRNHGIAFGYSVLGYKSLMKGLDKLQTNESKILDDIDNHWEVLAEPIQTLMRKYGMENPYELLKAMTRGKDKIGAETYAELYKTLNLPENEKARLIKLTPQNYLGNAVDMSDVKKWLNK